MRKLHFDRKHLSVPYLIYLILFVVMPLLVVLYYGFTDDEGNVSFVNFLGFFTNGKTMGTLMYSLVIAVLVTLICLLMAYPVAFILAKGKFAKSIRFL